MKTADPKKVLEILRKEYPKAKIALNFSDNWQLLVSVVLSAQCTDIRVNLVTPALFKKYPKVQDFAVCKPSELEQQIYSTGFYKAKAKNIIGAAKMVVKDFGGKVPRTMKELTILPGIARKSANVILSSGFKKNEGIAVDTHVCRLSGLLGFVPTKMAQKKEAVKIEEALMRLFPRKEWGKISYFIIDHGRKICIARRPKCGICKLNKICPSAFKFSK